MRGAQVKRAAEDFGTNGEQPSVKRRRGLASGKERARESAVTPVRESLDIAEEALMVPARADHNAGAIEYV